MDRKNKVNKWLKLLRNEISKKEAKNMLSDGVVDLEAFIKSDPHTEQRVVDILSRRLRGKITADTWNVMHLSLCQYFTEDLAYLLYWVANVENQAENRLEEVEKYAPPSVMAFLRAVVGIFCADLTNAFNLWTRNADDWRTIHREVYFDMLKQRHHLKIRIEKYSGEELVLEGPADFVLNLASALIYTANLIGASNAFSKASIEQFLDDSRQLTELLTAEKEETSAASEPKS